MFQRDSNRRPPHAACTHSPAATLPTWPSSFPRAPPPLSPPKGPSRRQPPMPHPTAARRPRGSPTPQSAGRAGPPPGSVSHSMASSDRSPDPSHSSAPDRMVKNELDAARALADFAQLALLESEHGRRRRRGSPGEHPEDKSFLLDLNQHASVLEEQDQQQINEITVEKKIDLPRDSHTLKLGLGCPGGNQSPLSGSKGKHTMSEAEKEAKKMRRILANRESARQTIRRRQAFREELTRKADSLSKDNEIMKKEKELVLREYLLLKDTNSQLKQKIAERLVVEANSGPTQRSSTQDPSSSTIGDQPVTQRLPFLHFPWPPLLAPISILKTPRDFQSASLGYEQGTLCLPPYPWFYPIMHQQPVSPSAKSCTSENQEDSSGKILDSSKGNVCSEKESQNHTKRKDSEVQVTSSSMLPLRSSEGPKNPELQFLSSIVDPKIEPKITVLQEKADEPLTEKGTDAAAAAAADARKRRKEMTKLKRLHGWQRCRQYDVQPS